MISFPNPRVRLGIVALLVTGILESTGCGSEPAEDSTLTAALVPQRGGTLVIGSGSDIKGLNQLVPATDAFTQSVLDRLFLSLLEERPDFAEHPPTFGPQIASSWDWSDDHLSLDLTLRDDVFWSDGVPLTADDVVWTWQAQTSPKIAWSYESSKDNIASIEAIDATSLRVRFKEKNDSQLWDLNEGVILPKHAWSQLPFAQWRVELDWFVENLVTSGPYKLDSWDRQQQIVLSRNELYFEAPLPMIDRLVFRHVPLPVNQVGQLVSGELDFVSNIPINEAGNNRRTDEVELKAYWAGSYNFLCWNLINPLFANTEIRQALTMAIDRQELIDGLWFGRAHMSTSPILSSVWAHNRAIDPWPYDPKESLRRLSAEGWSDSDGDGILDRNGVPFSFDLLTNNESTIRVDATLMIQEQLRRIGIEARVRPLQFKIINDLFDRHDFDAVLAGWTADTSLDQTSIFHSDSIDNGSNFGSYSNPELDRLIELSNTDLDLKKRTEVLHQVQTIIHHDQPYTFLWESLRLAGISKRVQDATPNALDTLYKIETWWLLPDT